MSAMPVPRALAAACFARTRWGWRWRDRAALLAWQERQIRRFVEERLRLAPFYAGLGAGGWYAGAGGSGLGAGERPLAGLPLAGLPIVDKATLVEHFDALNTRGIRYAQAMEVALAAERSRDFRPELGDVTVGLSSGTSGRRAPFLVSRRERLLWAASILARTLDGEALRRIASPWRSPLRVAFFLRANSNLYTTLRSRRVDFAFHDLLQPFASQIAAVAAHAPHVLVAPATVLRRLADAQMEERLPNTERLRIAERPPITEGLRITPRQVVSVAETLEPDDAIVIQRAFGCRVQQIYQATEGFLAYTCPAGTLHLNEECVHVEPEWLDEAHTRFHPIVTDFTRETQLIVRYRLDDVLRVKEEGCGCGRVSLALAGVDGRRDAMLIVPGRADGTPRAIFPDLVRRAMMLAGDCLRDYRILQRAEGDLVVRLLIAGGAGEREGEGHDVNVNSESAAAVRAAVRAELAALFAQQGVVVPPIAFEPWRGDAPGDKRCRIRSLVDPSGARA